MPLKKKNQTGTFLVLFIKTQYILTHAWHIMHSAIFIKGASFIIIN